MARRGMEDWDSVRGLAECAGSVCREDGEMEAGDVGRDWGREGRSRAGEWDGVDRRMRLAFR